MTTYGPYMADIFYLADKVQLQKRVDEYLRKAKEVENEGKIFGILSAHAGYEFCGDIMGASYKAVVGKDFDTVIILAVPHRFPVRGASCVKEGVFKIPLGDIEIDSQITEEIIKNSKGILKIIPASFKEEHSVEVQLPFIKTVLPRTKIVPVLVGSMDEETCNIFGQGISLTVKNKNCLIVVSSDMYHGNNYKECEKTDKNTLSILEKVEPERFYNSMLTEETHMCGGFGMSCLLYAAKHFGNIIARVLDYTNSSKAREMQRIGEYCVGYGSVIFLKSL